jgi:phospholipase/lecithinase/hemolysin
MIAKWSTRIGVVLLAALLSLPLTARAYSTLYVLGDSLSDTGNLYAATGALPQAPYYDGRFSNGPVYAEYLWTQLGFSGSLQPSRLGGTDYAYGGARSRYHAFDNGIPGFNPVGGLSSFYPFSLLGQRDALLAGHAGGLDPDALYTVWEGSNDVSDAIGLALTGKGGQAQALIAQAATDFIQVIADLVGAGAQHLLIPNIPNLGLVPEVVALGAGAQDVASKLTLAYNLLIANNLAAFGADIKHLDTYGILTALVADPTAYGLPAGTDVDTACFTGFVGVPGGVCSAPDSYVFWDKIHPSAPVHEVLGALAAHAVPEPASVLLAALALAALVLARRRATHSSRPFVLAT